MHLQETVVAR